MEKKLLLQLHKPFLLTRVKVNPFNYLDIEIMAQSFITQRYYQLRLIANILVK